MGHAGRQFPHHGQLFGLQKVLPAFFQFGLGRVDIFQQVVNPVAENLDDVLLLRHHVLMGHGLNQPANGAQDLFDDHGGQEKGQDKIHQDGHHGDHTEFDSLGTTLLARVDDVLHVDGLEAITQGEDREKAFPDLLVQDGPRVRPAALVKGNHLVAGIDVLAIFGGNMPQGFPLRGCGCDGLGGLQLAVEALLVFAQLPQPVGIVVQKVIGNEPLLVGQRDLEILGGFQGHHVLIGHGGDEALDPVCIPDHDQTADERNQNQAGQHQVDAFA